MTTNGINPIGSPQGPSYGALRDDFANMAQSPSYGALREDLANIKPKEVVQGTAERAQESPVVSAAGGFNDPKTLAIAGVNMSAFTALNLWLNNGFGKSKPFSSPWDQSLFGKLAGAGEKVDKALGFLKPVAKPFVAVKNGIAKIFPFLKTPTRNVVHFR